MNHRLILSIVCRILRIVPILIAPALGISLAHGEDGAAFGFLVTIVVMLTLGVLGFACKPKKSELYAREGFVVVGLSWLVLSALGALPFWISGAVPSYVDSFFETVSGFTTTGASILRDVEALPVGLLYWRSFTHWVGGMGVLVFLLAIVPLGSNVGYSMHLLRAESPGPQVGKLVPRMQHTAKILYILYILLTALQFVLLLCCGIPVLDAITTAYATAGTGGFAIRNTSMALYGTNVQVITTVFMLLFGVNFNVFYLLMLREFKKAFMSEELRLYLVIYAVVSLLIAVDILPLYDTALEALHHATFQVSSIMTTTGFATTDFDLWPEFSKMLLVGIMISGACAGSTGGGIKIARLIILFRYVKNVVSTLMNPRTVTTVRLEGAPLERNTVRGANAFILCYVIILMFSALAITVDDLSFETNVTAVIACLNNIGPGLDQVGPAANYADYSAFSKLILCADMLFGRLEIFPMLLLFTPSVWKPGWR